MPTVQQWLRLLSSSNPDHRKRAVDGLLPHLEQVPLPVLLELLDHPTSPKVRGAVASALPRCRDEMLAAEMYGRLAADDLQVRDVACRVLGELGDPAALTALLPLLCDAESSVRGAAAFSVAKLADAGACRELITQLPEEASELLSWARSGQEPVPPRAGNPDDEALIEAVFQHLADKATRDGLEGLSQTEQAAFLPYWAVGIIGNGGFRYFFEGATEIWELAAAFEALGLSDAAKACRLAGEQVPPEVLAAGFECCSQWMETLTEDRLEAMFERSDRLFPGRAGEISAPLAAYIREHHLAPHLA